MKEKKRRSEKKQNSVRNLLILVVCILLSCTSVFGETISRNPDAADQTIEEDINAVNQAGETADAQNEELTADDQNEESGEKEQATEESAYDSNEVLSESEETVLQRAGGISVFGTTASVSTWEEFVAALGDTGVSVIDVQANLTRPGTSTSYNPGTISRSLTIVGNGYTIDFGSGGTSSNGIILGAVSAGVDLILSDVYLVKTQTPGTPVFNQVNVAASSNWNIMLENVRTGSGNTAGLITATNASVSAYGTENNLSITSYSALLTVGSFVLEAGSELKAASTGASLFVVGQDVTVKENAAITVDSTGGANYQFYAKNFTAKANSSVTTTSVGTTYQFYLTGDFTMESDGVEGTGSSLTANASGTSNSVIYMLGGEVNLRKYSMVTIRNTGTSSSATAATGSNGIYGAVTHMNLEAMSTLDIYANSVGYRSNTTNYLTMVDGAVFKAETSTEAAIMLQNSTSESTSNPAFINISGEGTKLYISTESNSTGNTGAAMIISGDNVTEGSCHFTVTDDAEVIGYSKRNSVIQVRSSGSVFTIKDSARVELTQDDNTNNIVAALRFRIAGNQSFVIDGGEVYIHKTGGTCPAVRLYGGGNSITVTNGGNFQVYNEGNGSANNGSGDAGNQGVYYTNGSASNPDSFTVNGYGSKVECVADWGPAIYNSGGASSITVEDQAIFIATGQTSSATNGTINSSGRATITLDHPMYFDIRNNRPGGGNAIDAGNTNSTFTTIQSDLSVWTKGSDLDGNPSATWSLFDYSLSGADFRNIVSTNIPEEFNTSTYGMASDYARISANNATAVIDEFRVPTDADKYIYGHAYVPEGLEHQRDAWTDEVYVIVQVKDTSGNVVFTGTGTTVGAANDNSSEGLSVYGEPERAGLFKIMYDPDDNGSGDYLPAGYTVEVIAAWRGGADSTSDRVHTSTADDLKAEDVPVYDVTPPTPLTADDLDESVRMHEGNLTTRVEVISGTSEVIGATVYLYKNNAVWVTTTVGSDGKWSFTLPGTLAEGDAIAIALNDNVPNTDQLTSYDLTKLVDNGIYANSGNENPPAEFTFHDAVFDGRLELDVVYYGVLELTVSSEISYGTHGIAPGQTSYPAETMELKVEDSRVFRNEWELTARLEEPFTLNGGSDVLNVALVYSYNGAETVIGSSTVNVWRHTNTTDIFNVYDQWAISGSGNGLFVKAAAGEVKVGSYTAKVNWVLSDVP